MTQLVAPFVDLPFMQHSLLAGILVALTCAIAGTFVVMRGLAFLGDALAHGVLPGVAGAVLLGAPGIVGAAVGAALMIGGVNLITRKTRLSADTAIGLLFIGMLAIGVMMVSKSKSLTGDLLGILFGEILGISTRDLVQQAIALAGVTILATVFARPLRLLAFNPEQADVAGWKSRRYELLTLIMVTICVITAFQTVGTLLVFGMLLAPAGTGALLAHRVSTMTAIAALVGTLSVYLGLLMSYHFGLAAGASIVAVSVAIFFLVAILRSAIPAELAQR